MIRAVTGDGVFGFCPKILDDSVTFWRLIINKESILGKPCELKDIDSNQVLAVILLPEEIDQVSDNLSLPRI